MTTNQSSTKVIVVVFLPTAAFVDAAAEAINDDADPSLDSWEGGCRAGHFGDPVAELVGCWPTLPPLLSGGLTPRSPSPDVVIAELFSFVGLEPPGAATKPTVVVVDDAATATAACISEDRGTTITSGQHVTAC